ncbi:MAG: ferredoxin-NADP reductase [Caulobacteraceae bacterium]|nr:ferredoxin-NADP reductase [Caulobacteraceae bacterium]
MTATLTEAAPKASGAHHVEKVLWVKHWTNSLFSFAITRPESFRFRSGEFVMIGLPPREGEAKPILRAYSIGSPWFAEELEFLSIKVQDGPLTSRLQKIQPGDEILLGKKPTGTLVLDAVKPGKRLWLFSTGTGLAPFLSVARDPDAYERFEQIIVTHSVRNVADLTYEDLFTKDIFDDPLIGEEARSKLVYYPTVTREPFRIPGRITDRIESGAIFEDLKLPGGKFNPAEDRAMLCGSMAMIKDTAALLEAHGLIEGSNAEPGDYVLERAFVG